MTKKVTVRRRRPPTDDENDTDDEDIGVQLQKLKQRIKRNADGNSAVCFTAVLYHCHKEKFLNG